MTGNWEIDLFAHPGNHLLPKFGCRFPHPQAAITDALNVDKSRWEKIYIFPPPTLMPEVIMKLKTFHKKAMIIAPQIPSAPWWPELIRRAVKLPIELDLIQKTLFRLGTPRYQLAVELSRLDFLIKVLSPKCGRSIAKQLVKAHRDSTTKQYEYCWNRFQDWLKEKSVKRLTTGKVLQFLSFLVESKGLSPRTTISYKNALYLPLFYGFNISTKSKPFSLLINSQFIKHPPNKKLLPQWSLNKVLSLLEMPQYSSEKATKHHLMTKTLFIIALAAGNRISEISAFDRNTISFSPSFDKVTIAVRPGFLYKNEKLNNIAPNVTIPALLNEDDCPHALCPVNTLYLWLKTTKDFEGPQLFFNIKSGKPLKSPQLSQAIVKLINTSQPNTFPKAHDVRKSSYIFSLG